MKHPDAIIIGAGIGVLVGARGDVLVGADVGVSVDMDVTLAPTSDVGVFAQAKTKILAISPKIINKLKFFIIHLVNN